MVKVCEICGDIGDALAIITCCECLSSCQHLYCMRVLMEEAPLFWTCDECEQSADVDTRSCDAVGPHLMGVLPISEEDNPYIPSLSSYWTGIFVLPNGHEKFKAHLPSKVHYMVYKAAKKMDKELVFTLLPTQDVWTDVFPGYIPDTNDIGLYFFPTFKKRFENDLSITDILWRKKLVMKCNLEGLELLVFSSRLLQPNSQEFRGSQFLWGVLRRPKHEDETKTPTLLLLDTNCEKCDDGPPGFKKICKCC